MPKADILLVDDEAGILNVLGISLTDSGYLVHKAPNGVQALSVFRNVCPAIVLTDIKMPDMDGIELLRKIKKESPDTEVIMLTGHGDMQLAIESLKNDATDFITKPVNMDILEISLQRACERISMRRQIRDYTDQLERMVEEKARQLIEAERMAAVGEIVTELSHTIKNIANALQGSIFVLEEGVEQNDITYRKQGWEMLKGNVDKIRGLSLDLLQYGKYAGRNFEWTDPNEPVRTILPLMEKKVSSNGIDLAVMLDETLPAIKLDPEGVQRCLLNLVINAVEAFFGWKTREGQKKVILQTCPHPSGGVEYRVTDNGMGMSRSVRSRIFHDFFSTKGVEGTGIGLMMTRKIVDRHGGFIQVDSREGKGASICMVFPKDPAALQGRSD